MRLLFVDDEPRILEAIERMLFTLDDCEVLCAEGGQEALALMEEEPCDLVVTDMRMPAMDGAMLLRTITDRYPGTVRVVLSGHANEDATLRALPLAHQYLSKPCKPESLMQVISRTRSMRALVDNPRLREVIGGVTSLPSAPAVFVELSRALADPNTDNHRISGIVGKDPALSARVLQVANSSFFFRTRRISDVRTAVSRLGMQTIRTLALSVGLFSEAKAGSGKFGRLVDLLRSQAEQRAQVTHALLDSQADQEQAYIASMLCDVGQLVVLTVAPDTFSLVTDRAIAERRLVQEVELEEWTVTHAQVGAYLLGVWGLPFEIIEPVACHHKPEGVDNASNPTVAGALYVASCFVDNEAPDPEFLTAHPDLASKYRRLE